MNISRQNLPRHIAIIMDGNGRWAKQRALPRIEGHRQGVKAIREVVEAACELKIQCLTLYAFSQENWGRPEHEVNFLMSLLSNYLDAELQNMKKNGVRFHVIGRVNELPTAVREKIARNQSETLDGSGLLLTLAISYSSRLEIIEAVKRISARVKAEELAVEKIDEETFSSHLDTAGMPDPDLLIRTSGEHRISNFLLWQISYTELYVSERFWPDFRKIDFLNAIQDYQKRERRFGGTVALPAKPKAARTSLA